MDERNGGIEHQPLRPLIANTHRARNMAALPSVNETQNAT